MGNSLSPDYRVRAALAVAAKAGTIEDPEHDTEEAA